MGTNTIQGYEADPTEVERLTAEAVAEILASIEELTDPLIRYAALSVEQVRQDAVRRAVVSAILRLRGVELRRMAEQGDGMTGDQIANVTGLGTKQRVSQLIAR